MPMKIATKRIPNIYELFYDKKGNLLSSPDVISFKAQDNYANVLLINLEDGIEDNDLVLINFTPKNAVISYTTHWFYVRPLKKIREYIIEGEDAPRTFSTYLYEVPRIVLNNYDRDTTVENEITIVKRYGFNNLGVFNNYSEMQNSFLEAGQLEELYETNAFAYVLNDETISGQFFGGGYYQVVKLAPNNIYIWSLRSNIMNYGLEQKQYEVKTAYTEAGYANVDNVPNVEGTVVEALWRDLTSVINDIIDLQTFYELQFTPQETNTIALSFDKLTHNYFVVEANVKIDENNNDLLETSSDGLYVKHDDTKADKIDTYNKDEIDTKNLEQDNRLDVIDDDIADIIEVDITQNDKLQDHETRINKNTQDIAEITEGLVKIDNETITKNDNQELEVSSLVLNDISSRVKETDFISYQNTVQNFLNGKLDKKPDGVIDLINAFNKIDARYLEIDNEIFEVVSVLPATGVVNKIYLVPSSDPQTQNELDEFIWVDNAWEKIGSVTVDLSNYFNKTEINSMLDDKVDKNANITAGTHPKITFDEKGLVTGGADLVESDIPPLTISKVTDLQSSLDSKANDNEVVKTSGSQLDIIGTKRFNSLQINNDKRLSFMNGLTNNVLGRLYFSGGKLTIIDSIKNGEIAVMSDLDTLETSKQDKLVAGANITIDPNTNEISVSSGGDVSIWRYE